MTDYDDIKDLQRRAAEICARQSKTDTTDRILAELANWRAEIAKRDGVGWRAPSSSG